MGPACGRRGPETIGYDPGRTLRQGADLGDDPDCRGPGPVRASRAWRPALFSRSRNDRLVAGVAGGIAERLGVEATLIRLAFVVLAFAGGFGIVAYLVAWLIGAERLAGSEAPEVERRSGARVVISIAMVVAGLLLLLRETGLWLGDALVFSIGLAAFGSAIIWMRGDDARHGRGSRGSPRGSPPGTR